MCDPSDAAVPDRLIKQQLDIDRKHEERRQRRESQLLVLLTQRQRIHAEVNRQVGEDRVAVDANGGALVVLETRMVLK